MKLLPGRAASVFLLALAGLSMSACSGSDEDPVRMLGPDSLLSQVVAASPELQGKVREALARE